MDDPIARTRLVMRNGLNYMLLEDFETVRVSLEQGGFAQFVSVTGQSAFPPERLCVQSAEVTSVQEVSIEAWVWQQRASELHYARQLEEQTAADKMVAALDRMHGAG